MNNFKLAISILFFLSFYSCQNQETQIVKLGVSPLFSDHMVLQRNETVPVWGTCKPGDEVTIHSSWGEELSKKSNEHGLWTIDLKTPNAGGPHKISIIFRDSTIQIDDIMIGEVWLASGQSNMEMPVKGWLPQDPILNSKEEIANANLPKIRMLTVKRRMSSRPLDAFEGKWEISSPQSTGEFSATAYFFAKTLYEELNVPIGIIHSSWGGTPAEAWTNKGFLNKLGDFDEEIELMINPESQKRIEDWFAKWSFQKLPGNEEEWQLFKDGSKQLATINKQKGKWSSIQLPGRFDILESGAFDGIAWLTTSFEVEETGMDHSLFIAAVDDMDAVFINGTKVGGLQGMGFYNTTRKYTIPGGLLKKGSNQLAIRAIDTGGPGVVNGPIILYADNGKELSLEGEWKFRCVAEIFEGKLFEYGFNTDLKERPSMAHFDQNQPTALFNGMINPLIPYKIKGSIWYQGESNVGRAEQYKKLFPLMIENWRKEWGYDFPFYFVQIAPFNYTPIPQNQVSMELRDAQRYALKTPKTGMVVTMDIGDANNIHPANKQDVGSRLAGLALANDYGNDLISSGPLLKKVRKEKGRLILEFDHVGSGLNAKDVLSGFEIAGTAKVFVPAMAKIKKDNVEVSSPKVKDPVFVRYAWSDSPVASLFNKEGLPASSFFSGIKEE